MLSQRKKNGVPLLSDDTICPSPKFGSIKRLNTIANRDNDIQTIVHNRFVRIRNVQKMHIAFFVAFSLFEHIIDMAVNNGSVTLE